MHLPIDGDSERSAAIPGCIGGRLEACATKRDRSFITAGAGLLSALPSIGRCAPKTRVSARRDDRRQGRRALRNPPKPDWSEPVPPGEGRGHHGNGYHLSNYDPPDAKPGLCSWTMKRRGNVRSPLVKVGSTPAAGPLALGQRPVDQRRPYTRMHRSSKMRPNGLRRHAFRPRPARAWYRRSLVEEFLRPAGKG